jgi:putative spermidine/putrescine transport system substrate-binding protein
LDVVIQDDIGVLTLAAENLLEDLSGSNISNIDDIHARFRYSTPSKASKSKDLVGIGFLTYLDSVVYNSDAYPKPPGTYQALWDPKLKDKVGLPTSGQSDALKLIIIAAILAGGDQFNPEPGFVKLAELKPNVHSFWTDIPETAELIRSRDMVMAFAWNYAFKPYGEKGYPIKFDTTVKEGVVAAAGAVCVPRGHPGPADLIRQFIGRALSAPAQQGLAKDIWYGPTNRKVTISDPTVTPWILMPDKFDTAIPIDLLHLQTVRQDWLTKYDKILKG